MAKLKSSAKKGKASTSKAQGMPLQDKAEALSKSIMDSAQHIWLAGVGAFGRAQEEGNKLFDSLVKEGSSLEQTTRKVAGGRVDAVRDAVESRVGQVRERATDTWDRLEKVFEDRVQRALNRLGVPAREDLAQLSSRVEQLNAQLRKLDPNATRSAPAAGKTRASTASGKSTASKPTAAKPAAAKKAGKPAAAKKAAKPAAAKPASKPAARKSAAKPTAAKAPAAKLQDQTD
jgi:poly(hydroxyalkanoate) granule-associated protein